MSREKPTEIAVASAHTYRITDGPSSVSSDYPTPPPAPEDPGYYLFSEESGDTDWVIISLYVLMAVCAFIIAGLVWYKIFESAGII